MPIAQSVIMEDVIIMSLRDGQQAELLTSETGVRLHFDLPWSKMQYHRHYRNAQFQGEQWDFSDVPFVDKALA